MDNNQLKTIKALIREKSKPQLCDLIIDLCKRFPDSFEHVLMWGKSANGVNINEELALEYWRKAEAIVDEFNAYGGGPEDEEDEAYEYIEKVCELIPKLSWETRQKIMDGMLAQYHYGNSGFGDTLTDACFDMCTKREEWLHLAEKLNGYSGNWDKKLVMDIYNIIGDEENFLDLRKKNLNYGSDYFELVGFYTKKGDIETALLYAHEGLVKGEGRVDHLTAYLFDHYENRRQVDKLEELLQTCEEKKKERAFVSSRLYEYYKDSSDYDNAKRCLLKEFEYITSRNLDDQYKKMKKYLNDSDWNKIENSLFKELKKRDIEGYMRVCLSKGLKKEVYDIITEKFTPWGNDYDFFADKLKKDFPEKIIEYYFRIAVNHVENGSNRKSYNSSMKYFKKAKAIYLNVLKDATRWENKLAEIRERYKKRRAFLEESAVLD